MLSKKVMMVLVLALGGTAWAQEADPFGKAMEGAPPSGMKTGAVRVPEVPAPGPIVRPSEIGPVSGPAGRAPAGVAPAPASAPATAGVSGPAGASPDAPDDSVEINANYDATMEIYQKILQGQSEGTESLEKRIAANQDMKKRYQPELAKNEDQMRRLQVDFVNRAFQLRQQRESGQMSEDAYRRAIAAEQAKFERKKGGIAGDLQFYRDEMQQADVRLVELTAQKRTVEDRVARENAGKPKKKAPGEALFEDLNGRLDRLSAFRTSFTMDGNVTCAQCNSFVHDQSRHEEQQAADEHKR